jgi:outer membrane protein
MKKLLIIAIITLMAGNVFGQKFGYVNSEYILSQFDEFIEAQNKLEIEGKKLEQEYYRMAGQLDSLKQDYERQKFLMTDVNKKTKENEMMVLSQKLQDFQVNKLGPQGEFYQKQQTLADPVLEKVNKAIKAVGEANGYDFIFDSVAGNILYAKDGFDLTEKVLIELNRK